MTVIIPAVLFAMMTAGIPESGSSLGIWKCEDALAEMGINYHERVNGILLAGFDRPGNWISIVVLPSFEPEWAIALWWDQGKVEYRAVERQLWADNWAPTIDPEGVERRQWSNDAIVVPLSVHTTPISSDTANLLNRAWNVALSRLDDTSDFGQDGTTYRLYSGDTEVCGETWSPADDTVASGFVGLAERLRHSALTGDRAGLDRAIADLLKRIELQGA